MTTLAYISQLLPNLTETFVYREIFALRERGFKVVPLSIHAPSIKHLSSEAHDLARETRYVFPINKRRLLTSHAYYLQTRPHKYLPTLAYVLSRPNETRATRQRTLFHFGEAVYLASQVQRAGVQHVHAHFSVNACTIAFVLARLLDISFSFTIHNNIFTDQLIIREKIREAKFIAVISDYSRDFALNLVPTEPHLAQKFHKVHCGVSLAQFAPRPTPTNKIPVIFSVAQFAERKGYPYLIEACRILHERGYDFECLIGGDGEQRPLLEKMIAEYQLQAKVKLLGVIYQEKLPDYLNQADMFVLPCITAANGDKDGVPVVLMEAMAREIPVISTTVSGIPELIDHEQNGLLVPEKDATAFANAMQQLLDKPELGPVWGQHGRQKIEREFNIVHSGAKMAALFERYVG